MAYLLDADIFIRAKNLHYAFDFCPAFWEWLLQQNQAGKVYSIERVGNELLAGADDLADWARERGASFFLAPDQTLLSALPAISAWAASGTYEQGALSTFFQVADYYLVAHAYGGEHTVVTHEIPSASTRKIKIPDACIGLGIKCMTPYEMLRSERVRFVLGSSQ